MTDTRAWHRRGSHTKRTGYTLVELLVVLAILGLLAVIATPTVFTYLDSAKLSTARTEIANIAASLDLFKLDIGRYPTAEEGLEVLKAAPANLAGWNGPYVRRTTSLLDPWKRPYQYASPGMHGEFDLYSFGPKGEGSEGEKPLAANW
jgi:general secretion pathway protein G